MSFYYVGQYQYIDPWGNDIQVQYWVDSLGFHQTDNLPRYDLQPVTETPEVRQAREEHEKLWKEAARLNGVDESYNSKLDDDNYNDDQELEGQVSNQHQSLSRYPILPYSEHIVPDNAKSFGKVVDDSVIVDSTRNSETHVRFARQQNDIEDVTSEPRGFFYSFDYPVPFIVDRNAGVKQAPEAQASEQVETSIDARLQDNEVHAVTERVEEPINQSRVSERIRDRIVVEEEVHDTQISPKQRQASAAENIKESRIEEVHDGQTSPVQKKIAKAGRGSIKFNIRSK